jgi:hypothetical protein
VTRSGFAQSKAMERNHLVHCFLTQKKPPYFLETHKTESIMQVGLFICSQTQNPPKRVLCLLLQAFTCNSVDLRASLGVTPVSIHQSNLIDSAILLQGKKKSQAFLQVVFVDPRGFAPLDIPITSGYLH